MYVKSEQMNKRNVQQISMKERNVYKKKCTDNVWRGQKVVIQCHGGGYIDTSCHSCLDDETIYVPINIYTIG